MKFNLFIVFILVLFSFNASAKKTQKCKGPDNGEKAGQCLPSCGALGGTASFADACSLHGMSDVGLAYDVNFCCAGGVSTPSCPKDKPSPHYGVKNAQCLPSCGVLGGIANFADACSNHNMTDAGLAYDVGSCCKVGTPVPSPTASPTPTSTPSPTATPAPTPSGGLTGLKLHPDNPRFFQDIKTGKPVLINSYFSIVPTSRSRDYVSEMEVIKNSTADYARIWHFLPWEGGDAIWPWLKVDGGKWDMDQSNPEYWNRLKDALNRATSAGIVSEMMLFDRCGMSPAGSERWGNNPWASDLNVNNLESPRSSGDGAPAFYDFNNKPRLRKYQEQYMRQVIDATIDKNVIFEIENEHWQNNSIDWADANGKFVKEYMNQMYPDKKRLVSYSSLAEDLDHVSEIESVDILNKHFGNEPEGYPKLLNEYIECRWKYKKPINIDEFANGLTDPHTLRTMAWIILTSGGHFHIEDAAPESKPVDLIKNINRFKNETQWDFVHGVPHNELSFSGYCYYQNGVEYVCYYPTGGGKDLNMPVGNYTAQWWDVRAGGFVDSVTFDHPGGIFRKSTPSKDDDWLLYIKSNNPIISRQPTPTPDSTQCGPKSGLSQDPVTRFTIKVYYVQKPGGGTRDATESGGEVIVHPGETVILDGTQKNDRNKVCKWENDPTWYVGDSGGAFVEGGIGNKFLHKLKVKSGGSVRVNAVIDGVRSNDLVIRSQ